MLIFSGSKSSKLTNLTGVAHDVLSILNSFTLFVLYYILDNKIFVGDIFYIFTE